MNRWDSLFVLVSLMFAAFLAGHFFGWTSGRELGCQEGRASVNFMCPSTYDHFMYSSEGDGWSVTCPHECRCDWKRGKR